MDSSTCWIGLLMAMALASGPAYAESCPADLNSDCHVDGLDLAILLGAWGTNDPTADVSEDGFVDGTDLTIVLGSWGDCYCASDYSLEFTLDAGIRISNAANAQAAVDEDGLVWLYYKAGSPGQPGIQRLTTSEDGLAFPPGIEPTDWFMHAKNIALPPGAGAVWRRVWWDIAESVFRTSTSDDGAFFIPQEDPCYEARPEDTMDIGITDCFVTPDGRVVLLYIGDMFGLNNVRRAESVDGGASFTFLDDDVFGDADKGGTVNSWVDQRVVRLEDGRYRAFVMREGRIYSFTADENGDSFSTFDGELIGPDDIPDLAVRSLHDPSVVRMFDGSWRMYFTAFIDNDPQGPGGDDYEVLLSASTPWSLAG